MVDVWQAGGAQGADEESTVRVRLATRAELLVATLHRPPPLRFWEQVTFRVKLFLDVRLFNQKL